MKFTETKLSGAYVIDRVLMEDERGFFAREFCQHEFAEYGLQTRIAQTNVAYNKEKGTVRGMHFPVPPCGETKVVRCTRGGILDVIVDLRPESDTFLEHVAVELTAENGRALYVPARFAHGYQVLVDDTECSYLMGDYYAPDHQGGLRFDDPRLALSWPLPVRSTSPKDREWPLLDVCEHEVREMMALKTDPERV